MQALAAVPARQGSFVEEKHFSALDRPLIAHGTLDYLRPDHFEKTTTDPVPERLRVDGDSLSVASGGQTRTLQLSNQLALKPLVDAVLGVLGGDLGELQAHYQITATGSTHAWRLTLTPTDPQVRQFLAVVRIDGADATPLVFETVQTSGDIQRMTVTPTAPLG